MIPSVGLFFIALCVQFELASCRVDTSRWVGLTHPLSPDNPVYSQVYTPMIIDSEKSKATADWPGSPLEGIFVAFRYFEMYEHTGTHVDAPLHFDEDGKSEDELTWEELTGPLVIINVTHKASGKDRFFVTADDFDEFVANHGAIEPKSFVFLHTGWSQYFFTDKDTYTGKAPCIDESAIDWLLENAPDMMGFGIEALCPECNEADALYRLHTTILPRGQLIIENVGPGLEKLPAKGADLMIFPMHLKDGTGSPARLVAVWNAASTIRGMSTMAVLIFGLIATNMI